MRQKAFVKLEKKLACDLKPGELFVVKDEASLNGPDPMIQVLMRTNVSSDDFDGMDMTVYKIHITISDPEDPAPPKVNPHAPPGVKNER